MLEITKYNGNWGKESGNGLVNKVLATLIMRFKRHAK